MDCLGAVDWRQHHRPDVRTAAATSVRRTGAAVVSYLLDGKTCIGWLGQNQPAIIARMQRHQPTDIVLCSVVLLYGAVGNDAGFITARGYVQLYRFERHGAGFLS